MFSLLYWNSFKVDRILCKRSYDFSQCKKMLLTKKEGNEDVMKAEFINRIVIYVESLIVKELILP